MECDATTANISAQPQGSTEQIPSGWRCCVCSRHLEKLLVLPCQHRFCEGCIVTWIGIYIDMYWGKSGSFPCQICWKVCQIPSPGLQLFIQDYKVYMLEAQLQGLGMDQTNAAVQQPPQEENDAMMMDPGTNMAMDSHSQARRNSAVLCSTRFLQANLM